MKPSSQRSPDETSSSSSSQLPVTFEFVIDGDRKNRTQVRRHAMRASWRERKRQNSQNHIKNGSKYVRDLAPAPSAAARPEKDGNQLEATQYSCNARLIADEDVLSKFTGNQKEGQAVAYKEAVFEQETHSIICTDKAHTIIRKGPGIPSTDDCASTVLSSTIGSGILDALASYPYKIEPQDLELVHHWVGPFPKMMFGTDLDSTCHHNHSDSWIPLEFSNEASFHGVLAYAAAHLGHLRGDPIPALAIMHNLKAIEIINTWLHDPVMMISDAAIAAVMRQTTFENWWGNTESIRIHRQGLKHMIQLRGGLPSLGSNWRLALNAHVLLLVKEPYWVCPPQHRPIFPPVPSKPSIEKLPSMIEDRQNLRNSCHQFVKFFNSLNGLRVREPEISRISENNRYSFVEFAIRRLKTYSRHPSPAGGGRGSSHIHIEETIRFVTLLHIVVTWRDCLTQPETCGGDLEALNSALELKGNIHTYRWVNSIENMFLVVITGAGTALTSPARSGFVLQLMEIVRLLDFPSWAAIKDMLFEVLLENPVRAGNTIKWNAETLFTEIDGRY